MKTLLLYKSKTGFTEKYAKWIGEEIECQIESISNIKKIRFEDYDLIIYGSRIHAGMIDGFNKIRKLNISNKLVLFVTGATPAETNGIKDMWKNNLSSIELESIKHFYIPAGLNYEKMGMLDRMIMKFAASMLNRKSDKNEEDTGMENSIKQSYDISDKSKIKPLVNYVKTLK